MGESVLVAHAEPAARRALERALARDGFRVSMASTGRYAVALASEERPRCIVVDAGLPDLPGPAVCARLRAVTSAIIVVIAADGDVALRCACLDHGADDCVGETIAASELIARIRARLRRCRPVSSRALRFADVEVDTVGRSARRGDRRLGLTPTEYGILELLARRPRQVVDRDQIAMAMWPDAERDCSSAIDVHVHHLRLKLHGPGEGALLHTVRGSGYVLRELGAPATTSVT